MLSVRRSSNLLLYMDRFFRRLFTDLAHELHPSLGAKSARAMATKSAHRKREFHRADDALSACALGIAPRARAAACSLAILGLLRRMQDTGTEDAAWRHLLCAHGGSA